MNFINKIFLSVLFAGAGFTAMSAALANESSKSEKFSDISPYLQMDPMNIPVRGYNGKGTITIVLHARTPDVVGHICSMMPRIRDAVLRTATVSPAEAIHGKLVTTNLANQLPAAINQALRDTLVEEVVVYTGARHRNFTGGAAKLPFASNGCYTVPEADFEPAAGTSSGKH